MQNLRINLVLVLALCLAGAAVLWQMIAVEAIQQAQDQTTGELGPEWAKLGSGSEPIHPIPQKITLDSKKGRLGRPAGVGPIVEIRRPPSHLSRTVRAC